MVVRPEVINPGQLVLHGPLMKVNPGKLLTAHLRICHTPPECSSGRPISFSSTDDTEGACPI
jgi:hypothetical protein